MERGALRAFDRSVRSEPLTFAADAGGLGSMGFLSVTEELITFGEINQPHSVSTLHHSGSIARQASAAQAA